VRGRRLSISHRPGSPGRVPLVLCNGIGTSLHLFDPLVAALTPERPVVRFDVPGVGASTVPRVPYRYSTLASTLRGVVRELGYPRADVLGISWGGGLAQQYAFQYPTHCRRLVLVATATGMLMVPARPRTLARMLTPRRHRDPAFARTVAGRLYGGTAREDPDQVISALHRSPAAPSMRGYMYQLFAISGWTSLPFLPLIRQPTLVLAGDDDPLIPGANAVILSKLLPNGRLHRYRGGHLALLTEPTTLGPVIDSFLDEPDRPVRARRHLP
jgi:poly(3-hydroxyalkanoate) depolymerase